MSQPSNPVAITAATSNGVADSYIVLLKEECDQSTHVDWVRGLQERHRSATSTCDLTHEYRVIKGYSAVLKGAALDEVARRSDVTAIIQDNIMVHDSIPGDEPEQDDGERGYEEAQAEEAGAEDLAAAGGGRFTVMVQRNAPWGLRRVSDRNRLPAGSNPNNLNYNFRFSQALHPNPADVYVLDTGVYIQHQDFGGRARWGKTFVGTPDRDVYGHGTHVAGTIAGIRWGASKYANIIAVKVLGDDGRGPTSGIIAGIDWAVQNARTMRRASVINMSLGGSENAALDQASTNAVRAGVHVCVSAGNGNTDARSQSPARALDVFTVGATTIADARSDFSNFGPALEIFAPGSLITSAGITSQTAYTQKNGTSMASPHVAGVIAYLIYLEGNRDHAGMLARLKALGVSNVLTGVPQDTVNLLLDNGVPSQVAVRH